MPDKIEKTTVIKAPLAKTWKAISDSTAFGTWFGVTFEGPFVEGQTVRGVIARTQVDDDVAKQQEPYVGMRCDLLIERLAPPTLLAFRWHPGAEGQAAADSPTTLVTFQLAEVEGGTRLTITETGFEALPLERRAKAFADNEGGWEAQLGLLAKYLHREA